MKKINFILFVLGFFILFSPATFATIQDFTYDSPTNQVNITYDHLNRILTKNSTTVNITYAYDGQYEGTLSNITFTNGSYRYEYDQKMRLIREIKTVDGIEFEKRYYYDSMDRLVKQTLTPGNGTEYYYNNQSKAGKILGFINNSFYDAFDKISNKTYYNSKLSEFSYDSQNSRLKQIKTGDIQQLNYSYDSVGNVILINDSANSKTYRMVYDFLDRLVNASIDDKTYIYSYNAIGNILKIARDGLNTTKFIYGNSPVHAPSRITTVESGIDLHKASSLNSTNRTRYFEFYLANEKNATVTNANWTIDFGNSTIVNSSVPFNVTTNESIFFVVEQEFNAGGNYKINLTAQSSGNSIDFENASAKFGISVQSLSITARDAANTSYRLIVRNDMDQTSQNVWWSCNNGQTSDSQFQVSANGQSTFDRVYDYAASGLKTLVCSVNSTDGNDTESVGFEIKGIEIEDYNGTTTRANNRLVQFAIKNYYSQSTINWNITSEGQTFQDQVTLDTNGTAVISRDINYTTDGKKTVSVGISSGSMNDIFNESFVLNGLNIGYYDIHESNKTDKIVEFAVANNWPTNETISWNISEPSVSNTTVNLTQGESLVAYIENNYDSGRRNLTILASGANSSDSLSGSFVIKIAEIISQIVLSENPSSAIVEVIAGNNAGQRLLSWIFNNGEEEINSDQATTLNGSENVLILIENSYDANGVYPINITINSTSYNDTLSGAAIT